MKLTYFSTYQRKANKKATNEILKIGRITLIVAKEVAKTPSSDITNPNNNSAQEQSKN